VGVTNGEDALAKAVYLLPNLIITDLMMPKMNGIELIRRLKKDMNTSHIPIIMVTAKTGTDDIKEGYAAGADEYITKPFDASILKIRVDNLIQSREKLKELYSKNFSLESLGVDVTSVDEKFMQKLYATLQQNIANSVSASSSKCERGWFGLAKIKSSSTSLIEDDPFVLIFSVSIKAPKPRPKPVLFFTMLLFIS
jgi:CheY-like chemotaxis protein